MTGFDLFTKAELLVLSAFSDGVLVMPDINLSQNEISKSIASLKRRGYVTGNRPWRLTNKGRTAKQDNG